MKDLKITCDGCKRDITSTSNSVDYRLNLTVERLRSESSFVTDMYIEAPLERDHHFCGMHCLRTWVKDQD